MPASSSAAQHGSRAPIAPFLATALSDAGSQQPVIVLLHSPTLPAVPAISSNLPAGRLARLHAVHDHLQQAAAASQRDLLAWLDERGVPYRSFYLANAVAVTGDRALIQALAARSEVAAIEADPRLRLALPDGSPGGADGPRYAADGRSTRSNSTDGGLPSALPQADGLVPWGVERIRAPLAWDVYGITGAGVVLGSIDTGVDWTHQALKQHYRGWNGATANHNYNWHDAIAGLAAPYDDSDHGTHTTGTMVGDIGDTHIGVAPGASWVACKAMDRFSVGSASTFLECLQWMLAPTDLAGQNPDPGQAPHVVNTSWGCRQSDGCAAATLATAIDNLAAAGILVTASVGNTGPECSSSKEPPGIYPSALASGAFDHNDQIVSFSSRGPVAVDGSGRRKPDLTAPGWRIFSSVSGGGYADINWSGTSMASAHTAGAAALVLQAQPALIGDLNGLAQLLQGAADPRGDNDGCGGDLPGQVPNNRWGYGALDAFAAVQTALGQATVSGQVSHAGSGVPLPGAQVVFTNTQTSGVVGAQADANGSYQVYLPAGAYDVAASRSGYQSQTQTGYAVAAGDDLLLDFHLLMPGWLSGAVTDLNTHQPLAGATLTATPAAGGPAVQATTNAAGAYSLQLDVGAYHVSASALNHLPSTAENVLVQDAATTTLDFQLQGAGTLAGAVKQFGSGQPLPAASVQARRAGQPPVQWLADAAGDYSQVLPQGVYTVTTSYPQHEAVALANVAIATGSTVLRDFSLYPLGAVRGQARNADTGQPLPGAVLTASPSDGRTLPPRSFTAGGDGRFELVLPTGAYDLTASQADYVDSMARDHVVALGIVSLLDFSLVGQGALAGSVSGDGGALLAGAPVTARPEGSAAPAGATQTNAAGAYNLPLPRGVYDLQVDPLPGYLPATAGPLTVTAGAVTTRNFTLQGQGVLAGSLSDARFGGPLPGGQVLAQRTAASSADLTSLGREVKSSESYTLLADAQGFFSATLPSGLYSLTATYEGYTPTTVSDVALLAGAQAQQPLALSPWSGALAGRVVDRISGQPLAGARLSSINQASGVTVTALTGSDGAFSLAAPIGQSSVSAAQPGYANETTALQINHGITATATFSLTAGGAVDGVARSDWDGRLLAGVLVEARPDPLAAGMQRSVVTSADGQFSLSLPVGVYTVTASAAHHFPATISSIEVLTSSVVVQDLALPPAVGVLTGLAKAADTGEPRAGAAVQALRLDDGLLIGGSSNASGVYSLTAPVGVYSLTATLASHLPGHATGQVVVTGTATTVDLALWPLGALTGHATAATGGPLAGALLETTAGPGAPISALTDATGAYSLTLKAGSYDLAVSRPGYLAQARSGVTVSGGAAVTSDFVLQGVGHITGTVRDALTQAPLPGTSVALTGPAWLTLTVDANGVFSTTLLAGSYQISLSRAQYDGQSANTAIHAGQTTLHEASLTPLGELRGFVGNPATGQPIAGARVLAANSGDGRQWSATTAPNGFYSLQLPAGAYAVSLMAWGYEPAAAEVIVPALATVMRNWSLAAVPAAPLLVVNDAPGDAERASVLASLDALGESYHVWDVTQWGSASQAVLAPYCALLWLTGDDATTTLTTAEQAAVAGYLADAPAPHLLLSGDDLGYDLFVAGSAQDRQFYEDILRAYYLGENTVSFAGQGLAFLGAISFSLLNDGGADGHGYPSRVYPKPDGLSIAHYGDGSGAAIAWDDGYQLTYLAFKLSSLSTAAARTQLVDQTLYWFGCGAGACPADINRDRQVDIVDVMQAASQWGGPYRIRYDVNHDGVLGLLDVVAVAEAWTHAPPCGAQ